eukprot:gene27208-34557_t
MKHASMHVAILLVAAIPSFADLLATTRHVVLSPLPTLAGDGTTTNQTVPLRQPNTCNADCIPEHVKLKAGKPLCCTDGHASLKCPWPALYKCGAAPQLYTCDGGHCDTDSNGVSLSACEAGCKAPPTPPPPPTFECIENKCSPDSSGKGFNA